MKVFNTDPIEATGGIASNPPPPRWRIRGIGPQELTESRARKSYRFEAATRLRILLPGLLCAALAIGSLTAITFQPVWALAPAIFKASIPSLVRSTKALSVSRIEELAELASKPGGIKQVGQLLGKEKLPEEVLEDTYMRIVILQAKVPINEGEQMFSRLRGTDGFRSTLSKVAGVSEAKTSGHLYELRIADTAAQHNFKVRGIGVRFDDKVKSAPTDIDVILERNGQTVAMEAKNYLDTTLIPLDQFRADMLSLAQYKKLHPNERVIPVFAIRNRPADPEVFRSLQAAAQRHDVELLDGDPLALILQIERLTRAP